MIARRREATYWLRTTGVCMDDAYAVSAGVDSMHTSYVGYMDAANDCIVLATSCML